MNRGRGWCARAWLLGVMIWRRWIPAAAERQARTDRLTWRATVTDLQHRAAAEFRWTLIGQQPPSTSGEIERDG